MGLVEDAGLVRRIGFEIDGDIARRKASREETCKRIKDKG
jgi:hypothetical protein